jgi:hypothetical protein
VVVWQGRELAFAFGINLSCSRLGSVINNLASPAIATAFGGVNTSMFFGVIVCGVSLACALVMAPVDKAVDRRIENKRR